MCQEVRGRPGHGSGFVGKGRKFPFHGFDQGLVTTRSHLIRQKLLIRSQMGFNAGRGLQDVFALPSFVLAGELGIVDRDRSSRSIDIRDLFDHKQMAAAHVAIPAPTSAPGHHLTCEEPARESCNHIVISTCTMRVTWLSVWPLFSVIVSPRLEQLKLCISRHRRNHGPDALSFLSQRSYILAAIVPPNSGMKNWQPARIVVDVITFEFKV